MKKLIFQLASFLGLMLCMAPALSAQIVTTSPAIVQAESQNVVLTYHADSPLGNNGLKGLASTAEVYAHIGLITDKSTSVSDWKYAPAKWGDNSAKYKLEYAGPDTWTLKIGDIREYFGVTSTSETIRKIAVVFRTGDCSKEGKTSSGGDIFVDVMESGFQISLQSNAVNNVLSGPTTITYNVYTTRAADITLKVNGSVVASAKDATALTKDYLFSDRGNYEVEATATCDGVTLTEKTAVSYPVPSEAAQYPGGVPKMGIVRNADGTVTFCLAAPGKSSVVLVPSWDNYDVLSKNTMKYQDYQGYRYFWVTVSIPDQNTYYPYYYLVDGAKVGDPCAELVLDPYNDKWMDQSVWPDMPQYPYDLFSDTPLAVYCGNLHAFKFSSFEIPRHDNLMVYELLLRDFTGTEGASKGNGTVNLAIEKIPYLKKLGINAVELMPIMEFNGNNSWGYNTNFYMAPDKAYGSPLDYKRFIEECHRNGIAVILDIVFNQSDWLHPWYQMYNIKSNPFYNETAPHAYSVLNDWNQDCPVLQQHWKDVLQYWLTEYNVDGFRFDLVKGLGSNSSYGGDTEKYNASRVANMKALQDAILAVKPNGIHINEHLAGDREENEMATYGQLNWSNVNWGSTRYAQGTTQGADNINGFYAPNWARTWGSTVAYQESHDEERIAYQQLLSTQSPIRNNHDLRMRRLGSLAVQMLISPGSKMIWQFGELGADESTKSADGSNATNPKKVIWSYLDDPDRDALRHTYQEMCNLRIGNPDLFTRDAVFEVSSLASLAGRTYRIAKGDKEVVVFVNARVGGSTKSAVSTTVSKLSSSNCKLIVSATGFDDAITFDGLTAKVSLRPNEYVVYATETVTGINDIIADYDGNGVKVIGGQGEITVVGDYTNINVYTLTGRNLGRTLSVPAGMYIVNVDGVSTKVVVR